MIDKAKHTPGPWTQRKMSTGDLAVGNVNESRGVAAVSGYHHNAEADARLIAAAPDMLAALKSALALIKESGFDSGLDEETFDLTMFEVGAAISKATTTD